MKSQLGVAVAAEGAVEYEAAILIEPVEAEVAHTLIRVEDVVEEVETQEEGRDIDPTLGGQWARRER